MRSGSNIEELRDLPSEWFPFVHVCDAPAEIPESTEDLIHTAPFERMSPGEGGIDLNVILAALPSGLSYALEIPRARLAVQIGAKEHALRAERSPPTPGRCSEPRDLPARAGLTGSWNRLRFAEL